jgi:hypothetical protein
MSKQTKKYILNLDIEKDVRILRERLNICDEAIDYFYASSSILKAGTKAGLNLYEIAVMCCRNDDAGQIPSKLEVLFDMAGELAQSAIQNGRWGHAAAQRALVDQLSPHGGSLLTPNSKKSSLSRRAASAFDLNGLVSLSDKSKPSVSGEGHMPSMIQSAGSDSSSEADDAAIDDCDEWAAELIKNVSIDTNQKLMKTKSRSHSVESDGSSDSSADGFWQRSPGSVDGSDDETSINWSPSSSPSREILEGFFLNDSRMSYNPFEPARRSSLRFSDEAFDNSVVFPSKARTPTKVTFAGLGGVDQDFNVGLDHDNDPRFKHSNSDVGDKPRPIIGLQKPNMRRSQSYSALPSNNISNIPLDDQKATVKRSRSPSFSDEEYKSYYLKFVDLVIVREVTAAVYAKQDE